MSLHIQTEEEDKIMAQDPTTEPSHPARESGGPAGTDDVTPRPNHRRHPRSHGSGHKGSKPRPEPVQPAQPAQPAQLPPPRSQERAPAEKSDRNRTPRRRRALDVWRQIVHNREVTIPEHVAELLETQGYQVAIGVVPVLQQLLEQDPSVERAYLCHPDVQHVSKIKGEGGFCGYRNIQMMVSYINAVSSTGYHHFKGRLPTVFEIQELIESAWDVGINSQGREELGTIRNTRKHIGTPEAQALFCSLSIPCNAQAFGASGSIKATDRLMDAVETYFKNGTEDEHQRDKVQDTLLPPIYLQYPGHSLTIVGIEKQKGQERCLLVFDPGNQDSAQIRGLVGLKFQHRSPAKMIKPYRRGQQVLHRRKEFEILWLAPGT